MTKKSHVLLLPYGMYCDYDRFLKQSYTHLSSEPKFILFIAPSYNYCTHDLLAFDPYDFACIEDFSHFDRHFFNKLSVKRQFRRESLEFEREEVLYPHIAYLRENLKDFKCYPIFYNNIKYGVIKSIIEEFWGECSFVLLTTMSVGRNYDEARQLDEHNAIELENNRAESFTHMDFSAFRILPEIADFNKSNNFVFKRITLQNSAEVNGKKDKTTGYGAWYLDEHVN